MPGLFGWIGLAQDTADDGLDAPASLAEMAHRMGHGDDVVETWTDPARGFAIGRIAPRHLRCTPWPSGARAGEHPPRWSTVGGLPSGGPPGSGRDQAFVEGHIGERSDEVEERLRALARGGVRALSTLRGSFTAARWEPGERRLTLAVDRRASRPLAYAVARGRLWFAPEVKALLVAPGFDKALDEGALGVFLGAGYLLSHQTLFSAARRLAGGEALVVEGGRPRVERWHRYALSATGDGTSPRDLEAEVADLVRRAVERDLGDPARAVVFLSGGVDSRAIAEAAQATARRAGDNLRTVTWASPEARPGSDLDVAARVAEALGTRHRAVLRRVGAWGARLAEVTYLLDGLTDLPAYHASEHAVMRDLFATGARRVLRGDECFGWLGPVTTLEEARLTLNLRALGPLSHLDRVVRPGMYVRASEASAAALAEAVRPFAGAHPDDAKDHLYFRHRLQGYLGSAAYLKQVLLDHRAPLLDDDLLALNARIPAPLRADKRLFLRAAQRGAPAIWGIPLARRGNLEDWDALLASRSPVRAHVEAELVDTGSAIWELFDRAALAALLPPLGAPPSRSLGARVSGAAKAVARTALRALPDVERQIRVKRHRAGIRAEQVCLRVMVLKAWHDLFVTGDGSRRALAERLHATTSPGRAA